MTTENQHPNVPDWKLERFLLGELPADEMDRIRDRVDGDPTLERQLQSLRADDDEVRERYPAAWMARQIERRATQSTVQEVRMPSSSSVQWSRLWPVPAAVGLAAMLAFVDIGDDTRDGDGVGQDPIPGIRLKGSGPRLSLHRKIDNGSEQLHDGGIGRSGDLIQVRYHAAGRSYGAILSVDGNGAVTLHHPSVGDQAQLLQTAGLVSLAFSIELDDAPHWERFYFVTSHTEFELAALLDAAAAAGLARRDSLELDNDALEQFIMTLNKEPLQQAAGGGS